ncbi:monovalent cation/H(+) antiporter subunit G [Marinicrinis sediminis]|uniref:Monovalent cation/H(+) antiporter subunit G n=1 Tax=Marinicrinis sediminis TaxID=1652465 RepID=A0ABW5R6M2_9BACL
MRETIEMIGEPLVGIMILLGAVLSALSSFGLIRLPDVYNRSHAATKSSTLGVLSVLTGGFIYFMIFEGHPSARLILGIVFVFLTAPVAGHLICRAAYRTGVPLSDYTVREDLKEADENPQMATEEKIAERAES